MKRRLFKLAMAAMALSVLIGGVTPAGTAFYQQAGIERNAKAAIMISYNASTGELTVGGEISQSMLQDYAGKAKSVTVSKGTVFPADSSWMFNHFVKLERVSLNGVDMSKVTDVDGFFNDCPKLTSVSWAGIDTSKVTRMAQMFSGCESLMHVDLNVLDTSNVTSMFGMFWNCTSLKTLTLRTFDTRKVTNMQSMFQNCSGLTTIWIGDNWSTESVTKSDKMFSGCTQLVGARGFSYNENVVDKTYARIDSSRTHRGYLTAAPVFTTQPVGGFAKPGAKRTVSWATSIETPSATQAVYPNNIVQFGSSTTTSYDFAIGGPYRIRVYYGPSVGDYVDSNEFEIAQATPLSNFSLSIKDFHKFNSVTDDSPLMGSEVKGWKAEAPSESGYAAVATKWYVRTGRTEVSEMMDGHRLTPGTTIRVVVALGAESEFYLAEEYGGTIEGIEATATQLRISLGSFGTVRLPALMIEYVIPEMQTLHDMYRLYNPNSGEHFYTASVEERDSLVGVGWKYEGVAWTAPEISNTPVYRLYNPNAGDHHYTPSDQEKDNLVAVGWKFEGIGWYSDDAEGVPLHRLFNPNAQSGAHHYTTSEEEKNNLVTAGWQYEGIGWYGVLLH